MTTVREFGPWVPVPLEADDVFAVRQTSIGLKSRLGLNELPLSVRMTASGPELRARHVAGFIQVGSITIEVAPKFLVPYSDAAWRDAFLAILARLGKLNFMPRIDGTRTEAGLPDLMGLVVDDALSRAATEGLPRQYVSARDDLTSLRGQLDAERLWRRFVDPEFMPCRFDLFTEDTPAGRLLKWAATELSGLVSSASLATQLRTHAESLRHVINEPPSELARDRIHVPPQYGYLDDAIAVARMLASGDALSMSSEREAPARAFLWKTASIFEDFAFEVCRTAMFKVGGFAKKVSYVLATPTPGAGGMLQRRIPSTPDVVLTMGQWAALIDAKYKTLKKHPKSSDVYQVMAGGRLIRARAVGLMYPAWHSFRRPRTWRLHGSGDPVYLHALPLNLTEMALVDGFNALVDSADEWFRLWRATDGQAVSESAVAETVAG